MSLSKNPQGPPGSAAAFWSPWPYTTKEPGLNRNPRPTGPLLSTTSSCRKRMGVAAQFSCGG
ncbi:hypothetical protein GE21DRAFT_1293190 [Neurospora crassa]|nr:hypothetical protein GE21DRAFT_1293190 [Neurospora crassa]